LFYHHSLDQKASLSKTTKDNKPNVAMELYDQSSYIHSMKVTALISDDLIDRVRKATGGKNITESITIALTEYLQQKEISYLIDEVEKRPLQFQEGFTAYKVRKGNRNR
jgi:hypothetical protein